MRRTLRAIRQDAPATDRRLSALAPSDTPQWAKGRNGSRYVATSIYPQDNDELRKLCREFGHAAVTDVQWGCVVLWLFNDPPKSDFRNSMAVASLAVGLVRERDRTELGWPTHDGAKRAPLRLAALSAEVRGEAELVASETLLDWERAGKPHMGRKAVKTGYQFLISCPAFITKYVRNLDDNKEQK